MGLYHPEFLYLVYFSALVSNSANVAPCHAQALVATMQRGIVYSLFYFCPMLPLIREPQQALNVLPKF